jgi:hypothetical protein
MGGCGGGVDGRKNVIPGALARCAGGSPLSLAHKKVRRQYTCYPRRISKMRRRYTTYPRRISGLFARGNGE